MKRVLLCILLAATIVGCSNKEPIQTPAKFSIDPKDYEDVQIKGVDIIKLIEAYSDQDYCIFIYTEGLQDLSTDLTDSTAVLNYNTLADTATMNGEYNTYICMADTDNTGRISIKDHLINENFEHIRNDDLENAKQNIDADKYYKASSVYLKDSNAVVGVYFKEVMLFGRE